MVELSETFEEALESDATTLQDEQIAKLKAQVSSLTRDNKIKTAEAAKLREQLDLVQQIEASHMKAPAWASPPKRTKEYRAIPSLLLSDLHLDETVDPDEVEGLNAYSREIAEQRLQRCVEKTIMLSRDYISGVGYDGMYVFLGGDMISGFIHEELAETNEAPVPETVEYWLDPLSAALGTLADEFKKVHVAGVVGNHGRLTRKPRNKHRATDNIDWLIYRMLMRDFRNDDRFTWQIPTSADCTVEIYNTKYLFTHGDQFRGGSGIAGIVSPLMLGVSRKAKRAMQLDANFNYAVMGHFHQYSMYKSLIVNGSLKGYDEYAYCNNFEYEPPQQAFWVTTPENGITMTAPILVSDPKKERWG